MKIFTVVGARPNFIKVDRNMPNQEIVHTGQHYDYEMAKSFFEDLALPEPTFNLECPSNKFGEMIDKLRDIFKEQKPDMVLVYGDTISSLAGALAASFNNIKIAHVEAGLRSYTDIPEEKCRVLIDKLATIRFCPNAYSELNLMKEGLTKDNYIVGDPSFDSLGRYVPIDKSKNYRKYSVLTLHRDFNVDNKERLQAILQAIGKSNEPFVFPMHPRTAKMVRKFKIKLPKNIKRIKPQPYKAMLSLVSNANKVVTDSGGIQREAYWFNVPVIITRKETEWLDIIQKGAGILVDADEQKIIEAIATFKGTINPPPDKAANPKIREIIYKYL